MSLAFVALFFLPAVWLYRSRCARLRCAWICCLPASRPPPPPHHPPTHPNAGNPLSPTIPFAFGPYRFWQLARSLWALGAHQPAVAAAPTWAAPLLVFLLAFWCFDHGVTALQVWM